MEERWLQRKEDLIKATARLQEALNVENVTDVVIDGALHRFEFTFELAWKTMKDYLEYVGLIQKTGSPREVLQNAYQNDLIDNGEDWIEMMLSRNTLSHLYDEDESREIYEKIKNKYEDMIEELINGLNSKENEAHN